jgi:hypothetical protein
VAYRDFNQLKKAFGKRFHILGIDAPAYIHNLNCVGRGYCWFRNEVSILADTDFWKTGKFYLSIVYVVLFFN